MAVTRSALNGFYKTKYGEKNKPLPSFAIVQRLLPFKKRAKIGKEYSEPVFTRRAHGVTFQKTSIGTVYSLAAARSIATEEAKLSGAEIIMREQIAYGAIAAAEGEGNAFGSTFDEAVLGIEESHRFYLESMMLYGRTSIATCESITAASATTSTIVITKASWAPGLWAQAENALVDVYTAIGGTKINTEGAVTITSLSDVDNRTILVTASTNDSTAIVAGTALSYILVWRAAEAEVLYGIDSIVTATTGTMFNINVATNSVWRSNTHSAGSAALTMATVLAAQTKAVVRGGMGDMVFLMNPYVWQDLADDQAALRRHGESTMDAKNGFERITFQGTGGKITFEQHPMVKCGEAFGIMPSTWLRGGESDVTDKLPGASNDDFFHEIPDYSGSEMRNFSSQFILNRKPAAQVKITNIVCRQLA